MGVPGSKLVAIYWVGQKFHLGFSVRWFDPNELSGQPIALLRQLFAAVSCLQISTIRHHSICMGSGAKVPLL